MIKNLLRLLAASASFIALLLITNNVMRFPQIDYSQNLTINQPAWQPVSLNIVSPSWELIDNKDDFQLEHLGCSCALCNQGIEQGSKTI